MQQRVAVTRAIAQQNEILAFDEPFGALDISNRSILQELFLSEVAKQKSTAIFVTHDINEAILVSNRILCFTKINNRYKIFNTDTLTQNTSSSVEYFEKQKEIIKYLTNGK
jgi:NitT/TauT family transport system ATP-binding protein